MRFQNCACFSARKKGDTTRWRNRRSARPTNAYISLRVHPEGAFISDGVRQNTLSNLFRAPRAPGRHGPSRECRPARRAEEAIALKKARHCGAVPRQSRALKVRSACLQHASTYSANLQDHNKRALNQHSTVNIPAASTVRAFCTSLGYGCAQNPPPRQSLVPWVCPSGVDNVMCLGV